MWGGTRRIPGPTFEFDRAREAGTTTGNGQQTERARAYPIRRLGTRRAVLGLLKQKPHASLDGSGSRVPSQSDRRTAACQLGGDRRLPVGSKSGWPCRPILRDALSSSIAEPRAYQPM